LLNAQPSLIRSRFHEYPPKNHTSDPRRPSSQEKKVGYTDFQGFEDYARERKSLYDALISGENPVRIIAEIKKASPSKGVISHNFDAETIAGQYMDAGAAALSVLTDEPFFQGHLNYMKSVARRARVPVLRKDFIVDPYQIQEARGFGADAVLLIAAILSSSRLDELHHAAEEAGLECLVECYDQDDFNKITFDSVRILGVNNRNLNTFEVDVHRGVSLLKQAPSGVCLVSESGLSDYSDLQFLARQGIHAALIGEQFMKAEHPGDALKAIQQPKTQK